MSRNIINDHLWTEEEVEYQLSRNRHVQVEMNRKLFGPGGDLESQQQNSKPAESMDPPAGDDEGKIELDRDIYEYVKGLNAKETAGALKEKGLTTEGNLGDQKGRLAAELQKARNADNS